jgi:exopolysaccharide production protein ExoZ
MPARIDSSLPAAASVAGVAGDRPIPVFKNVQALRAVAALLVVLLHMGLPDLGIDTMFADGHNWLAGFGLFGEFGVDVFFVISGFVMLVSTWNLIGTPKAGATFFLRRAIRIYPPYWLALLPVLGIYFFARTQFMRGHAVSLRDMFASLFLYPNPTAKLLHPVAWTLVYEMTFYVIFAIIISFNRRYLNLGIAVWACAQVLLFVAFARSSNPYLGYAAHTIPLEFLLGMLVGIAYVKGKLRLGRVIFSLGILAAVAAWIGNPWPIMEQFEPARLLFYGLPAALLVYGAVAIESNRGIVAPLWLVAAGNASYAVYLWHFLLIDGLHRLFVRLQLRGTLWHLGGEVAALATILAVGALIFRFFERPVTSRLNRALKNLGRSRETLARR